MSTPESTDLLASLNGRERRAFRWTCMYFAIALVSVGTLAGVSYWQRLTMDQMRAAGASPQEMMRVLGESISYSIPPFLLGIASGFGFLVWFSSWLSGIRERRRIFPDR